MTTQRPYILSIAGFDPSAGAGILSDIKTFESHGAYGFGVSSALTFQNDIAFEGLKWTPVEDIIQQIKTLSERFTFEYVKIGLMENLQTLETVVDFLISQNPNTKITWDPILKASAGYRFHEQFSEKDFLRVCDKLFFITPNREELEQLLPSKNTKETAEIIAAHCNICVKSWQQNEETISDLLIYGDKAVNRQTQKAVGSKHGTGCVFSASVTANLAQGMALEEACKSAQEYVAAFIASNEGHLGYHSYSPKIVSHE